MIWQDLRYAARTLARRPGFTSVVVLTLALCIGANTAIFSVVNAVLLRPLAFDRPEELVRVYHVWQGRKVVMSPPNFTDVRRQSQSFTDLAAYAPNTYVVTGSGEPALVDGAETSAGFFQILGVPPVHGRTFLPDENEPGHTHVAVLGHALWRQRYGADPKILGKSIELNGASYEVVGVMPEGFSFPAKLDLWIPLAYDRQFTTTSRGAWFIGVIGRLRPGVTLDRAAAEVGAIGKRLEAQYPDANGHVGMTVGSLREAMIGEVRRPLVLLTAAVAFVLLIACANIANLLLARSASRQSEMAVRSALGANQRRLVTQLLTESLVMAAAGAVGGLLIAYASVPALVALQPQGIPRLNTVRVDGMVVVFTAAVAVLTGLLFGLAPALQLAATRADLAQPIRAGGRGTDSGWLGHRLRRTLIVAQMALALVLLTTAGLLINSFARLQRVDPGFRPEGRMVTGIALPEMSYDSDEKRMAFYNELMDQLRARPGITSVGAINGLPLTPFRFSFSFEVSGRPPVSPADQPSMQTRIVTPDYFRTMGVRVVRGRTPTDADRAGAPRVAVINEAAAREFFPNEDPIGSSVTMGWSRRDSVPDVKGMIVGIVGDVRQAGLDQLAQPEIYFPYDQVPVGSMTMVIESDAAVSSVVDMVRREIRALDPRLPVAEVLPLGRVVAASISQPRFYSLLLGVFAGVALVLAAVGIGGVMSFTVAERTREIGIRSALGATRGEILRMMVGEMTTLAGAGVALGTAAAAASSKLLSRYLFEVAPRDPVTYGLAVAVLMLVALAATFLPARRAASIDPAMTLRLE